MKKRPMKRRGGIARGRGKDIPPKRLKPLTGVQSVITRQTTTCIFVAVKNTDAIAGKRLCDITAVVHRQRDDPCYKCDRCACARFRGEWTAATTLPELIRTARCSQMPDVFNMCSNRTVARTISSSLVPRVVKAPRAALDTPFPLARIISCSVIYTHKLFPVSHGLWRVGMRTSRSKGCCFSLRHATSSHSLVGTFCIPRNHTHTVMKSAQLFISSTKETAKLTQKQNKC